MLFVFECEIFSVCAFDSTDLWVCLHTFSQRRDDFFVDLAQSKTCYSIYDLSSSVHSIETTFRNLDRPFQSPSSHQLKKSPVTIIFVFG